MGKNRFYMVISFTIFFVCSLFIENPAASAVFNVASGDVPGLVDAIIAANSNAEPDTIDLSPDSTYTLSPVNDGRIPFPADGLNGLPSITSEIIINGNGATITGGASVLDGTSNTPCDRFGFEFRIFHVDSTGDLTLNDLTVSNGCASGAGFDSNGGGIFVDCCFLGVLEINNCTITGNSALLDGGGIVSDKATVNINFSTISGNSASRDGGGFLYGSGFGIVEINSSTISGNSATFGGGVFTDFGTLEINNTTVSGNSASEHGGGILNFRSTVNINNSTVSGNSAATEGGGIFNLERKLEINNSTVSGNTAGTEGAGIFNNGDMRFTNTIIANNLSSEDCDGDFGVIESLGFNIDSDGTCNLVGTGDRPFTGPLMGPLAPNGGPTNTHALLPGSPAIDMGNPSGCLDTNGFLLTEDQRGFPRPQGTACDIGAFESIPPPTLQPSPMGPTFAPSPPAFAPDGNDEGTVDVRWRIAL